MRSILYTLIQCGQLGFMNRNTFLHILQNSGQLEEDFTLDQLSGGVEELLFPRYLGIPMYPSIIFQLRVRILFS